MCVSDCYNETEALVGDYDAMRNVLDNKFDVNTKDKLYGNNLLHRACESYRENSWIIQRLLISTYNNPPI